MAGDQDADVVAAIRGADGAGGVDVADGAGLLTVSPCLCVGDRAKVLPDALFEVTSIWVKRYSEIASSAGKILRQLGVQLLQMLVLAVDDSGLTDLSLHPKRSAFESALLGEVEHDDPAVAGDGEHRAQRG